MSTVGIYSLREDLQHTMLHVDMSRCVFYGYSQREEFFNSMHSVKIAVVEPNYANTSRLKNELLEFEHCDLVIVYSMELTKEIYNTICKLDRSNYKFVINGLLNHQLTKSEIIPDIAWFYSTSQFYQTQHRELLENKLSPFRKKDYWFDVMYGNPRVHRSFVNDFLNSSPCKNQFYQAPYFQSDKLTNAGYNFNNQELWEDEIVASSSQDYYCTYLGTEMQISQVLPFKIYNKTCYSLVTETCYDNQFSFFTEKTVKPILAHRLFIIISGRWFLKNLKSLGFKTFDSIIDESYDNIQDDCQRWTAALEQAEWLCKQDPDVIFKKIIPIVTHNFEALKNLSVSALSNTLERALLLKGFYK